MSIVRPAAVRLMNRPQLASKPELGLVHGRSALRSCAPRRDGLVCSLLSPSSLPIVSPRQAPRPICPVRLDHRMHDGLAAYRLEGGRAAGCAEVGLRAEPEGPDPTVTLGRYRRYRREAIVEWVEGIEAPARARVPARARRPDAAARTLGLSCNAPAEIALLGGGENGPIARRSYGTGSLTAKTLSGGREVWVGLWYDAAGRRVKRQIGPKRRRGEREGLTKAEAERVLSKLIDHAPVGRAQRLTVGEAGERYSDSREALGRSPVTVEDYRSVIRVHLDPFFGH